MQQDYKSNPSSGTNFVVILEIFFLYMKKDKKFIFQDKL